MIQFLLRSLVIFNLFSVLLSADTIYIIGEDNNTVPAYWTIVPPDAPSSFNELDENGNSNTNARDIAISPIDTVYIVGNSTDDEDSSEAVYWTVSSTGTASLLIPISGLSSSQPSANGIAFTPAGIGYIVGVNESGNPAYWTISTSGTVTGPTELSVGGFAVGVGFSSTGSGYFAGTDSSNNVCYWSITAGGVVSGPVGLVGGESGGAASAYAVAFTPSGTAYIVGNTTASVACYWTISSAGVASSAFELDGGSNSNARDIAFRSDGSGIIVGQATGNQACYWTISPEGVVSTDNPLPNGSGNGSSAYGVAYTSTGTAYIVGGDNSNQAVFWTLAPTSNTPEYNILDSGGVGIAYKIAIRLDQNLNPPQNLSGKYVKNDFGWIFEYCAILTWSLSDSSGIVAYNVYKNGVKIATVSSTTTTFENHNQKKAYAQYAVTSVDESGNESEPVTVVIK